MSLIVFKTALHIFAGGYAAGYYNYLWAEVLASDIFARFEKGIWNQDVGRQLRQHLLAKMGPSTLKLALKTFRGRAPNIDALCHWVCHEQAKQAAAQAALTWSKPIM